MDDRLRDLNGMPWRKIHLSIGGDPTDTGVGADFNVDEFAKTLDAAAVDSLVFPAKNIDGYCYYPSAIGPVHPGLATADLLGGVIEACRSVGVKIYPYYSYAWDEYLADRHPEWLVVKRDRTTYAAPFDEESFLTALCLSHEDRLQLAFATVDEVLDRYDVDGIWYDEVFPFGAECFCWNCRRVLTEAGKDPFDADVQLAHKHQLRSDVMRELSARVHDRRPGLQVDFNTQAVLGLRDRLDVVENIDIEALPTGGWGYGYFPLHARFARSFGVSVYGMTGKFHHSWGEYGGVKLPIQLRTELAGFVAQGSRCDIGDQALPHGRLDAATYAVVGEAYREIRDLEPHLEGAVPVTEAAILVTGNPLARLAPVSISGELIPSEHGTSAGGLAKLLTELQVQFDVVDGQTPLERYRLLALPDSLSVDDDLAARLRAYLAAGGKVIAAHHSLRTAAGDGLWPVSLAAAWEGPSPYADTYSRAPELVTARDGMADYDFAHFGSADRWRAPEGVEVLGRLVEPTAHQRKKAWKGGPPGVVTDFASVVLDGGLGAVSWALGSGYFDNGYWFHREVFSQLLDRLYPERVVTTTAPMSAEVTLTHQAASDEYGERWIVHVVNYSPLRSSPAAIEFMEDPIALRDTEVGLAVDAPVTRAYDARSGVDLPLRRDGDRWTVTVPSIEIAAMVVFATD